MMEHKLLDIRRNRQTGTEIALHVDIVTRADNRKFSILAPGKWYTLECRGHGSTYDCDTRREAERLRANPLEWCVGCIEGDPVMGDNAQNANSGD